MKISCVIVTRLIFVHFITRLDTGSNRFRHIQPVYHEEQANVCFLTHRVSCDTMLGSMNNDEKDEQIVADEDKCPECATPLVEHHEMRGEVGMFEVIRECPACGYTESE